MRACTHTQVNKRQTQFVPPPLHFVIWDKASHWPGPCRFDWACYQTPDTCLSPSSAKPLQPISAVFSSPFVSSVQWTWVLMLERQETDRLIYLSRPDSDIIKKKLEQRWLLNSIGKNKAFDILMVVFGFWHADVINYAHRFLNIKWYLILNLPWFLGIKSVWSWGIILPSTAELGLLEFPQLVYICINK